MPDTWSNPRVWVVGERVGASKMNEVSTLLRILYPYTTAGDTAYRDPSGNYLTRLAKPSVDSVWKMGSAGTAAWHALAGITGLLHKFGYVSFGDIGQTSADTAVNTNVTNATVDVVTTRTCTIIMLAQALMATGAAGHQARLRGSIGGTVDGIANNYGSNGSTSYVPTTYFFRRTGVTAGTITCLLKFGSTNAGVNALIERGAILVLAFVE